MNISDKEIIYHAITMWQNYIQTGDVCMSAKDCENVKEKKRIKNLTIDQMEFLVRMDKLKKKFL